MKGFFEQTMDDNSKKFMYDILKKYINEDVYVEDIDHMSIVYDKKQNKNNLFYKKDYLGTVEVKFNGDKCDLIFNP